ncbi:MAG: response regulator [Deltaproteobacteria bacterium]|nr:response regulator [Deltaproteobacteria bacterium]
MDPERTILVIDDDPNIILFCETVLTHAGFRVVSAYSASDGWEVAQKEEPDLIVVDVMMEEVDSGFHLARRLHGLLPDVPILMLSAIADASAKVFDISSLPVSDLVDKPIEASELLSKVRHLLRME